MKKRFLYIFVSTLIAFIIWIAGELVLMFLYPESSLLAARIWVISVLVLTCIWNCLHFYRAEKKKREEEANENYKGVY